MAGIRFRCLLNPNLRAGRLVKLDNASINTSATAANAQGAGDQVLSGQVQPFDRYTAFEYLANTDADGQYRVVHVSHHGATRENAFYSDVICLGMEDTVPIAIAQRGLG